MSRLSNPVDEFSDFGIFSEIQRYFRDKYFKSLFSYQEFDSRARHFIAFLIDVTSGAGGLPLPETAKQYAATFYHLEDQSIRVDQVITYLKTLGERAQKASPKESPFYQRFLVRIAWPMLTLYSGLSEETFRELLNTIPVEMLISEQQYSVSERFSPIDPTNLFLHLRESVSESAIDRFCMIVSCFPEDDGRCTKYCFSSTLLQQIKSMQDIDIAEENRATAVEVFQTLLLSVREQDVEMIIRYIYEVKKNDFLLIQEIFCSYQFLILSGASPRARKESRYPEKIFSLLLKLMIHEKESRGEEATLSQAFNAFFLRSAADNEWLVLPQRLVDVSYFSSNTFGLFFSILSKEAACKMYSIEYLQELLLIVSREPIGKTGEEFNEHTSLKAIIKFVLNDLYAGNSGLLSGNQLNLLAYCQNIRKEIKSEVVAKNILSYCKVKKKLYQELEGCVEALSVYVNSTQRKGGLIGNIFNTHGASFPLSSAIPQAPHK